MDGIQLTITPIFAGILAMMYVGLAFLVINGRRSKRISLGTGDDDDMVRRVRAHGNFGEYVPSCLLVMLMQEIGGTSALLLYVWGVILVLGRIGHAWTIVKTGGTGIFRIFGMVSVFAVLVGGGLRLILMGFGV